MPENTTKIEAELLGALLTPAQFAREINTTSQTVNRWHREGILPAKIAVGRIVRFDRAEALAALAAQSRNGGEE